MRTFKTWRDPYGLGFSTCYPRQITIEKGLTVFVGCNGLGKSTLLRNINEILSNENTPVKFFDDIKESQNFTQQAVFNGDYRTASMLLSSSEGEQITVRIGSLLQGLNEFIATGLFPVDSSSMKIIEAFKRLADKTDYDNLVESNPSNERWLLFDATDSGYSIDNVIDMKELFKLLVDDAESQGVDLYILIAANEYELADGTNCFDVARGKYITFSNYADYKQFILKSRKLKDDRLQRGSEKNSRNKWNTHNTES